ncbi:hypothetical protein P343_05365 [Sporolactobacillus laevolacticus DSM 442]|uniref:Uncharacterized protein n=1 Tax=Sporolactobacillus laevolacticus DSM 442 TaxID=1395513 RepID=V6J7I8_9BACL|nr:hypothetical protein P343_05365 [Sporolactobacillus laevolacticus DSM 442]
MNVCAFIKINLTNDYFLPEDIKIKKSTIKGSEKKCIKT